MAKKRAKKKLKKVHLKDIKLDAKHNVRSGEHRIVSGFRRMQAADETLLGTLPGFDNNVIISGGTQAVTPLTPTPRSDSYMEPDYLTLSIDERNEECDEYGPFLLSVGRSQFRFVNLTIRPSCSSTLPHCVVCSGDASVHINDSQLVKLLMGYADLRVTTRVIKQGADRSGSWHYERFQKSNE